MEELNLKVDRKEFEIFVKIIKELNKISETHKLKWDEKGVLVYTIIGEASSKNNSNKINALKTFYLKRTSLFSNIPSDLDLIYTIVLSKNFIKKFDFILDCEDEEFDLNITYSPDTMCVYMFEVRNTILEMRSTAGEDRQLKDLTIEKKKEIMDPSMATWDFEIDVLTLDKIKKIAKTDIENDVLTFKVEDGKASFGESQWNLIIKEDCDGVDDIVCTFQKTYLNSIVPVKDTVKFSIFPTYILVDETKSHFLFNLELLA